LDEEATPGYYRCRIGDADIDAELTVAPRTAHHRYSFPEADGNGLVIDFSCGGLFDGNCKTRPEAAGFRITPEGKVVGFLTILGIPFYIEIRFAGGGEPRFFKGQDLLEGDELEVDSECKNMFGVMVPSASDKIEARISFSLQGEEKACSHGDAAEKTGFDKQKENAAAAWSSMVGRISIDTDDDEVAEIFYSALYHSLIKPIDCTGEDPDGGEGPYFADVATMWDQYKTVFPLILSVYPETGKPMVESLLAHAKKAGRFLNCIQLRKEHDPNFDEQARGLLHCTLLDAFNRGYDLPWGDILEMMRNDLEAEENRPFFEEGMVLPVTHTLDLAVACHCTAVIADHLGHSEIAKKYHEASNNWKNVYDPETGRLIESVYYEGGLWNYSFRLLHDMKSRIALYGSSADFVADLDRFFGYGQPPVKQIVNPSDKEAMDGLFALNRFEGFNNEPDMETPYAYVYAGRQDRTAEVVKAGMKYMFTTGKGGAPGNVDSGGLTSCYVWNALGIFPAAAQPLMLIGSPLVRASSISVGEKTFRIETVNLSEENIYVLEAKLNGRSLDRAWISMDEFLAGGTLELTMGDKPNGWGSANLPQ
ncbi:MAG: glycoside hydrolase family 92 protein, partial [Planctomycetes bacterium]|nr:glycoside hydrolase family 92 protein [Planctomycetota bacterium]